MMMFQSNDRYGVETALVTRPGVPRLRHARLAMAAVLVVLAGLAPGPLWAQGVPESNKPPAETSIIVVGGSPAASRRSRRASTPPVAPEVQVDKATADKRRATLRRRGETSLNPQPLPPHPDEHRPRPMDGRPQ